MNLVRAGRLAAIAITIVAVTTGSGFVVSPFSRATDPADTLTIGPAEAPREEPPANADSMVAIAVSRDPFRVSRAPAPARYGALEPTVAMVQPRPPRPTLSLAGIVGGTDPMALIDGLPGSDGTRALREGERIGELVLRRIASDGVVIAAPDTSWTLHLRTQFP